MALSPEFDKIQSTKQLSFLVANGVECKLPLGEEEAKEIISIDVSTYLTSVESYNREVKYTGRAIFTVIYKQEGEIKKHETGVEYGYKASVESALEGMNVFGDVKAENVKLNVSNGIVTATCIIVFNGDLVSPYQIEYLVKEPELMLKNTELNYCTEVVRVKKETKIEDEYDMPILIKNVLSHQEKAYVTNCQSGIGVIIVDGELEVSSVILPVDTNKPISASKIIPFRVEIDCQDALPEMPCSSYVSVKATNIKVYVDENKCKSAVSVETTIEAFGLLFQNNSISLVDDVYSKNFEIKTYKENKVLYNTIGFRCIEEKLNSEIFFENTKNSRLICVLNDKIEDVSYKNNNGSIEVSGVLLLTCLFEDEKLYSVTSSVPFTFNVLTSGNKFNLIKVQAVNVKASLTNVEYTIRLSFLEVNEVEVPIICKVEEGAKKKVNDSAISVYIPKNGDTMWDVCKALGVNEDVVLKTNKDLEFPLSGDERIVIYRER